MKRILAALAGCLFAASAHAGVISPGNAFVALPANPSAQTSTTGIMAGIGVNNGFVPRQDGIALVTITGTELPSAAGTATLQINVGTGTPPANNASPVGTICGGPIAYTMGATTGYAVPFSMTCVATGLALGNGYWFDIDAKSSAGSLTLTNIVVNAVEE